MIIEDLIFNDFGIRCPNCSKFTDVSFEDLRLNAEVTCERCQAKFHPNKNPDDLLTVIKEVEGIDSEQSIRESTDIKELQQIGIESPEDRAWVNQQLKSLGEPELRD